MGKRKKARNLRNLYLHGDVWSIDVLIDGKRYARSLGTTDPAVAIAARDRFLAEKRAQKARRGPVEDAPTFAEMAKRVLAEDCGHLAATTREDRVRTLAAEGPILPAFGDKRLDAIAPSDLRLWWS